jgi:hypothetical protein
MEPKKKKGADAVTSTPRDLNMSQINSTFNYSRLVNLCLALSFIAITMVMVGYLKHIDRLVFFGMGMMLCALFFHIGLNPITKEEEDEDGEYL